MNGNAKWHQMTADAVCGQLHTNAAAGLDRRAARSRFKKEGANTLFDSKRSGTAGILRPLFCDPSILLMLLGVALGLAFIKIAVILSFLLILAATVGIVARVVRRRRRVAERITKYRVPTVRAVRGGILYSISARRVVAGDILILREGDIVPCDCRILRAQDARVLTVFPGEDGTTVFSEDVKNAQTVYPYGTELPLHQCENMLCGGSEVLCGEIRAVAVAVGAESSLGAMELFSLPAEPMRKKQGSDAERALKPFLRLWGIATILLILVMSIPALLRVPQGWDMIDIFFSLCVWLGCASPALITMYVKMTALRAPMEGMQSSVRGNRTVFKSERSADVLSTVTDVLVIGRAGSSDGTSHLLRAAVGRGEIQPEADLPQPLLQPLCEAFFLLKMSDGGLSVTMNERGEDDTALLSELLEHSGFDLPALHVRLTRVKQIPRTDGVREISVEMRERCFGLLFSEGGALSERCTVYEDGDRYCAISPTLRQGLRAFEVRAKAEAARVITVVRRMRDGSPVLLGMVAVREALQGILPSVCEELSQCRVQTYFFLDASDQAYAEACRLPRDYLTHSSELSHLTPELLARHRVFFGFDEREITRAMALLRKEGRRVAILTLHADRQLCRGAPLLIACDPTEYHRRDAEEAALEALPREGMKNSTRCSQTTRRRADLLVARANGNTGGLAAVLQGLAVVRAARMRICLMLSFLCVTQCSRLVAFLLFSALGLGLPNAAAVLYVGGWAQTVCVLGIGVLPLPQALLRHSIVFDEETLVRRLFPVELQLPTLTATLGICLYAAILTWCRVITSAMAATYGIASVLLIQTIVFYATVRQKHAKMRLLHRLLPLLLSLIPACVVLPILHFVPAAQMPWSIPTLAGLSLGPILYLLTKIGLSFFRGTAK